MSNEDRQQAGVLHVKTKLAITADIAFENMHVPVLVAVLAEQTQTEQLLPHLERLFDQSDGIGDGLAIPIEYANGDPHRRIERLLSGIDVL